MLIGGGLGRTPMIGKTVREFLPKADLLPYLEAILQVYNLLGRRDNKFKARLKILVHETGLESGAGAGRGGVRGEPGADAAGEPRRWSRRSGRPSRRRSSRPETAAPPLVGAGLRSWVDTNVAAHKLPHYAIVSVSLKPIGGTPGDATAEQMRRARRPGRGATPTTSCASATSRTSSCRTCRGGTCRRSTRRLKAAGLATANIGLVSDIIACPGMDYCALATARSIPVAQGIAEAFADLDRQRDIGPLKIKISGCINACGHHHVGHIGILGLDRAGVENYQITLGGDGTETAAIGEKVGPGFAYDEIVPAVERLIEAYLELTARAGRDLPRSLSPRRRRAVQGGALRRGGAVRCGLIPTRALRADPLDQLEALRLTYGGARPQDVLAGVYAEFPDQVALVSSFGADAAVLLHMASEIDPGFPVLMLDTLMLFQETLDYQAELAGRLGLTNVQNLQPDPEDLTGADPTGTLHQYDTDACCEIRKVMPLDRALERFPVTISGRKRFQSATRAGDRGLRGTPRPAADQPAGGLDRPGHPRLHGRARSAAASAGGQGLPVDRLRPLHHAGEAGRGSARRTLARNARRWSAASTSAPTAASSASRSEEGAHERAGDRGRTRSPTSWAGREVLPFDVLWSGQDLPEEELAVDFPNDRDPADLAPWLDRLAMVRVAFPAMGDGRGFSIARRLRAMGYTGRLRAKGPLIPDQFRAARRVGYDEVELPDAWRPGRARPSGGCGRRALIRRA